MTDIKLAIEACPGMLSESCTGEGTDCPRCGGTGKASRRVVKSRVRHVFFLTMPFIRPVKEFTRCNGSSRNRCTRGAAYHFTKLRKSHAISGDYCWMHASMQLFDDELELARYRKYSNEETFKAFCEKNGYEYVALARVSD